MFDDRPERERRPGPVPPYDWAIERAWSFAPPDLLKFPCLGLAYAALRTGGTAPAILNAANEEAVEAFLGGAIGFWQIQACVAEVLAGIPAEPAQTLEQVMGTDLRSRVAAKAWIRQHPI